MSLATIAQNRTNPYLDPCKRGSSHINAMNEKQETTSSIINLFVCLCISLFNFVL